MIRAVSFDAGGTLIHPWPSVGHVYAEEAARHGWPSISPDLLNSRFRRAWSERDAGFSHTEQEWADVVDATFGGLVGKPPSRTFFPSLYERFVHPEVWRVFDDVLPALEQLKRRGVPMLVVSNWDSRLRPLLEGMGLAPFFSRVLISLELGSTKPDAGIFKTAAESLDLAPGEILHVGDDEQADTAGALAAGFQARTVVRGERPVQGNYAISSLSEILSLLPG